MQDLSALLNVTLPQVGCGPFTLLLLYKHDPAMKIHVAANRMRVSVEVAEKWHRVLEKDKLLEAESTSQVDTAFALVKALVINHPRYKMSVDTKQRSLNDKARLGLTNLINQLRSQRMVEAYCKWWMAHKKGLRFSFGLFTCAPVVNEFKRSSFYKTAALSVKEVKIRSTSLTEIENAVGSKPIHREAV